MADSVIESKRMRYDDDRYLDDEEEKDFWDDELDLSTDDTPADPYDTPPQPYIPDGGYAPYAPHESEEAEAPTETPDEAERGRFFGKKDPATEVEEENDYYDSDAEDSPQPVKKTKAPKLDPEDPDYWMEEEESPFSGIISGPSNTWIWKLVVAVVTVIAVLGAWIWFLRPYSDNAVKYGYIKNMERRGSIIKTFEGTMIPYKELGDPNPFYFTELPFSVQSDSLAAHMKRMMLGCVPVRIEYETYHTPLPWKGEQTLVVVRADTADPSKILPPEYR